MKEWELHERFIERTYEGKRTKASGSGVKEKGDVRVEKDGDLVECKVTEAKRTPRIITQLEKVATEAYEEGLDPALALRYYLPDSTLADGDGYVDVMVRLVRDDARRDQN